MTPWALALGGLALVGAAVLLPRKASAAAAPSTARTLAALRTEYRLIWDGASIRPERLASVNRVVDVLVSNRARYEVVARESGVPWWFIAAIHSLEGGGSSGRFTGHLHNGDPLTARTTHVPANRPSAPPRNGSVYTWEESATDALLRFRTWSDWSLPAVLWQLERYNGFGSRGHGINTPYLWSFTTAYTRGKFVSDGVYNASAVSAQVGGAAILKTLERRGLISIPR